MNDQKTALEAAREFNHGKAEWKDACCSQSSHAFHTCEGHAALIEHRERAIVEAVISPLPATFYAHLPPVKRVQLLVNAWQRAEILCRAAVEAATPEIKCAARIEAL